MDEATDGHDFPTVEKTFVEARRFLHPGGIMVITEVLPSTIRNAIWYTKLNQRLCGKYCGMFPSINQYIEMVSQKFKCVSKCNILGIANRESYTNPEGPLHRDWRKVNGISFFAMATEEEMQSMEAHVRQMIADGKMTQFVTDHDKTLGTGHLTVLACIAL